MHFYPLLNLVTGKDPLAISLEMRWIPQSDILLAPAIATKPNSYTLYLEILSFENTDYTQAFFIKVANYWKTLECEGVKPMYIPHWGKQWKMIPQTSHYSYEVYDHDEAMKQLKDICDLDPNNVLINETSFDHQMSIVLE